MKNTSPGIIVVLLALLFASCKPPTVAPPPAADPSDPTETISTAYFGEIRRPSAGAHSLPAPSEWYKDARFYHIWVNAFSDSDGDGIGDLQGIVDRLDYLENLGISAIWLSPIFETRGQSRPLENMHGYDTTDHYAINPYFGDSSDVARLLDEAHARNIRVIFDFVPNHVSNHHPWFTSAAAGDSDYDDWFVWAEEDLDVYYNGPWGSTHELWHGPEPNGNFYYGIFWDGMPDLNYHNIQVRQAMADVVTYWLNFGFDGVRIDAVKYLFENDDDGDPQTAPVMSDADATQDYFLRLREDILDRYGQQGYGKFMVLENWTATSELDVYASVGGRDAAQMSFDFEIGGIIANAVNYGPSNLAAYLDYRSSLILPEPFAFGNFLSNHDNVRSRPMTEFGGSEGSAVIAAAYNILLPGVPFIYYGNEIGMEGAAGYDIDLRQALPWSDAAIQAGDDSSILEWYRAFLTLRSYAAVGGGSFRLLSDELSTDGVFSGLWTGNGGDPVIFVINHNGSSVNLDYDLSAFLGTGVGEVTTVIGAAGGGTISSSLLSTGTVAPGGIRAFVPGRSDAQHIIGDRPDFDPPAAADVHLPGTWNTPNIWNPADNDELMTLQDYDSHYYSHIMSLAAASSYAFKFHDGNWIGGDQLTHRSDLTSDIGGTRIDVLDNFNIILETAAAGDYVIHFDLDDREYWFTGP
jgi:alpha-amylase